ncbi:AC146-like protein [Orgyia pseudotsugata single capsid nuclopolyhedrovirus]|nr:AC146-like protein [Orgyia pseudotsugata single capsid nuclopolyhedrovirus]
MNFSLYYPCGDDNGNDVITFTLLHAYNSVTVFVFGIADVTDTHDSAPITRLVSGYEKNIHRRINMNVTIMKQDAVGAESKLNGYVISCVRLPYISTKLITTPTFNAPPTVVIVKNNQHTEVWHIFSARKHVEAPNSKKITGLFVNENGRDVFYPKELINLNGNVPNEFVSALAKHTNNVQDVDIGIFMYPDVQKNENNIYFTHKK